MTRIYLIDNRKSTAYKNFIYLHTYTYMYIIHKEIEHMCLYAKLYFLWPSVLCKM